MDPQDLLRKIDEFAAQSGLQPSTVCQYALKYGRLHGELKNGREPRRATVRKMLDWLDTTSPEQFRTRVESLQ